MLERELTQVRTKSTRYFRDKTHAKDTDIHLVR
jgi:hypothetical protein